jgi:hypothetical protein
MTASATFVNANENGKSPHRYAELSEPEVTEEPGRKGAELTRWVSPQN